MDGAPESLVFDRRDTEVVAHAYARVAQFPYDQLAHRGRKFLWPCQWGWRLPYG